MSTITCTVQDTGLDPVTVPLRSMTLRYRQSPKKIYTKIVIPNGLEYIESCMDREAGTITLTHHQDGNAVELVQANIETVLLTESEYGATIQITAYKQTAFPGTSTHTISNPIALLNESVLATPVPDLRPGDTVKIGNEQFSATEIEWRSGRMEIKGREPRGSQLRLSASHHLSMRQTGRLTAPPGLRSDADILPVSSGDLPSFPRLLSATQGMSAGFSPGSLSTVLRLSATINMDMALTPPPNLTLPTGGFKAAVLDTSPLGYWAMDGTGSTESNLGTGGSTYDGTLSGTYTRSVASIVPGDTTGACTTFTSGSGLMTIPSSFPDLVSPFTVMIWFDPNFTSSRRPVFRRQSSNFLNFEIMADTYPSFLASSKIGSTLLESSAISTSYVCVFVTMQYTDNHRLYVNDQSVVLDYNSDYLGSQSSYPLTVGSVLPAAPLTSKIQHVAIWNRVLGTAERENLRNEGMGI